MGTEKLGQSGQAVPLRKSQISRVGMDQYMDNRDEGSRTAVLRNLGIHTD